MVHAFDKNVDFLALKLIQCSFQAPQLPHLDIDQWTHATCTNANLFLEGTVISQSYNVSMINFIYLFTPFGHIKVT